jgi:hypothetical protein
VLLRGREDVDDAAAHGELAPSLDEVHPDVRSGGEPADQRLKTGLVAGGDRHGLQVGEPLDLRLEQRAHRRDHDPYRRGVGVDEAAQHGEAPADRVGAR